MTVAELQDESSFTPLLELRHDEMLPFVQGIFASRGPLIRFYLGLNLLILLVMLGLGVWQWLNEMISFWAILGYSILGLTVGLLPLIPIHEWIHGLAYKVVGAPKVSYGANWSKFYFYAVADHYVVNRKAFRLIALAPFFVINTALILTIFFVNLKLQWFFLGLLLIHTAACSGDFAMLSFYLRHKLDDIYTYDDVKNKISYFYRKRFA